MFVEHGTQRILNIRLVAVVAMGIYGKKTSTLSMQNISLFRNKM